MKKRVYSVYDSASGVYGPPMLCLTDDQAVRDFAGACNGKVDVMTEHAEHFTLFFLGIFDDSRGKFEELTKASVVNGKEVQNVTSFRDVKVGGTD